MTLLITFEVGHAQNTTSLQNKNFPQELKAEIIEALSYYPELWKTHIDFIYKDKIKHAVMQAQPRIKTLFKNRYARTYKIKISRALTLGNLHKPIQEVPHDILVGWIAHELGHVMDYLDRSAFQMIGFGFNYVMSKKYLMHAERQADRYAIAHGLANKIIKTKNYILHNEKLSKEYRARIDRLYISPDEVRHIEEEMIASGG